MRPSVWKWPRASRGRLMLRMPVGAPVSTAAELTVAVLASAGVAVILSAICAMMVPRPTMIAARIIMLRMTPHSPKDARYQTSATKPRLKPADKAVILTKRMSEGLTGEAVMRGIDPRIHQSSEGLSRRRRIAGGAERSSGLNKADYYA